MPRVIIAFITCSKAREGDLQKLTQVSHFAAYDFTLA